MNQSARKLPSSPTVSVGCGDADLCQKYQKLWQQALMHLPPAGGIAGRQFESLCDQIIACEEKLLKRYDSKVVAAMREQKKK